VTCAVCVSARHIAVLLSLRCWVGGWHADALQGQQFHSGMSLGLMPAGAFMHDAFMHDV
jgi:hypothetical protein